MSPKYRRVLVIPFVIFLSLVALLLFACEIPPTPTSLPPTSTPTLGGCNELNREMLYPLTPAPVPTVTPPDGDLKLFWEIRAEVNCGEVQMYKDISIWQTSPELIRLWRGAEPFKVKRVSLKDVNLTPLSEGDCIIVGNTNEFNINDGVMAFNGGYIKCQDWTLQTQVLRLTGYTITQVVAGPTFEGKDVNIQTEINLVQGPIHAIMFYPQVTQTQTTTGVQVLPLLSASGRNSNGVVLLVNSTDKIRNIASFEIDGNPPMTYTFGYSLTGWHDLRVREYALTPVFPGSNLDYFVLLVDNVGLAPQPQLQPGGLPMIHHFSLNKPQTFYIGYHPEHNLFFMGEMSYFIFDPNDSCPGCGGS